jgi:signal transduction histidine kinase
MTIKRRLFISNILMFVLTLTSFAVTGRIILFVGVSILDNNAEVKSIIDVDRFRDEKMLEDALHSSGYVHISRFIFLAVMLAIMIVINNIITYRFSRTIVRPLDALGEGVRQIHNNHFAYRIAYPTDDEFRPVCEAFNEMAGRLEASIEERNKNEANRRELIAGISHDLRTPLTVIKAYLEGIEEKVASTPEKQKKYFDTIKTKTDDLEKIINQLFLFSKLDLGKLPMNLQLVNIGKVIPEMVDDFIEEYKQKGILLEIENLNEYNVKIDVQWLHNVFVNILENSAKYKKKDTGKVRISSKKIHNGIETAEIHLRDDGPGVLPETLEKLFDVFYRTDPSRNTRGSGLGLAISAKIIQHMGGTIRSELAAEGGLDIVISFPIAANTEVY